MVSASFAWTSEAIAARSGIFIILHSVVTTGALRSPVCRSTLPCATMFGEYTAAPHDHPFCEIIRHNELLYSRLETYSTDQAGKLFLLELRAFIKRYAQQDGSRLFIGITKPAMAIYTVNSLLTGIEAEIELCEERIRLGSGPPQVDSSSQPDKDQVTGSESKKQGLYGNGREVVRFVLAAERAGLLPKALPPANIATCFGIKETTYTSEYRRLRSNYTPSRLGLVQPFLEQWLMNMDNDELESIILTIRKLMA